MKIFLVDDSAILLHALTTLLAELDGVTVIGRAQDAPEAIEAIPKASPDVVILDVSLPTRSGYEVLTHLKALDPSPTVIMFSNYSDPELRQRYLKAGADFYLNKTDEFSTLGKILMEIMSQ